jgi:8-oxo-dGTP diphosphatase
MKIIEVVAAIIVKEGKILATRRGYGDFMNMWEFPGGKIEPGESKEAALIREIQEELRVAVSIDHYLYTVNYDYPDFHLTMHCYICSIVRGEITLVEHNAAKWLSADSLHSVEWLPADTELIEVLRKWLLRYR